MSSMFFVSMKMVVSSEEDFALLLHLSTASKIQMGLNISKPFETSNKNWFWSIKNLARCSVN